MGATLFEPRTRRWTREEYYRLAEEGWFEGQRVQLIHGEIIQMPPRGHAHAKALMVISRWLYDSLDKGHVVRIQMPLNAEADSDPEPDAAVASGPLESYRDHPTSALFVVEVADSSLKLDREKEEVYAGSGVGEYWIVNVDARQVEVYRDPDVNSRSYRTRTVYKEGERAAPLGLSLEKLEVARLFV